MLGNIEISCDSVEALRKGIELSWIQMINARHYDVLWEIFWNQEISSYLIYSL